MSTLALKDTPRHLLPIQEVGSQPFHAKTIAVPVANTSMNTSTLMDPLLNTFSVAKETLGVNARTTTGASFSSHMERVVPTWDS